MPVCCVWAGDPNDVMPVCCVWAGDPNDVMPVCCVWAGDPNDEHVYASVLCVNVGIRV